MSDPYEGPSFCKDCGEEVFTSLEAVCGKCLACSRFASMEEYQADWEAYMEDMLAQEAQVPDNPLPFLEDDIEAPKGIVSEKEFWHIASGGIMSEDAANSNDIQVVRKFYEWNMAFAKKHIKPYVNPLAYSEVVNQMTRGLPARMAQLQTKSSNRSQTDD